MVQEFKAVSTSGSSILVVWRKPTPSSGRIANYVIQVKDSVDQEMVRFQFFKLYKFLNNANFLNPEEKIHPARIGQHFGLQNWPASGEPIVRDLNYGQRSDGRKPAVENNHFSSSCQKY